MICLLVELKMMLIGRQAVEYKVIKYLNSIEKFTADPNIV